MSKHLTIPEGLTIQLDYKNCLMPHQEIEGSISRPFVLPKENAKFFEFYNRVNKVKSKQPITPISLYSKGIKLKEGILKLNKFTEDGKFDCDFIFDAGAFYSIIKDKYLNDIEYLYEPVATNVLADWYTFMNSVSTQEYPDVDVAFFPVYTSEIEIKTAINEKDKREAFRSLYPACLIANYWSRANDSFGFPETDVNGDTVEFLGGERAIIPFWYVGKVVEEIFKHAGYTIKENVFKTNSLLKKLVLFNLNTDREQPDIFGNDNFHISFKYDLPHVLISEFVSELRNRGIIFSIKEDRREVDIKLLKDIINETYDKDYSSKAGKGKTIEYNNIKKVKFTGEGDGYLNNASVQAAQKNGTLHVINSRDYDINDDDTEQVYVIRDEKVIRNWHKANYNDLEKTMFNTQYGTNNYYEASNETDGEELEIKTNSVIIENKEIWDVHEYWAENAEICYKRLMPYTDVKREFVASKIKQTTFGFLFYWGKVEQPLRDDTEPPYRYSTTNAPFGSNSNEIIKPRIKYANTEGGAEYKYIWKHIGDSTYTYKIQITYKNNTNTPIEINAMLYLYTDMAYDGPHIGDSEYLRDQQEIHVTVPANDEAIFLSKNFEYYWNDEIPLNTYCIIEEALINDFRGLVFYIDSGKQGNAGIANFLPTREAFAKFNNTKDDVSSPFINFIKQDVSYEQLKADISVNIQNEDMPYNKGTINNEPIISIALDKWVPTFLQEYVDMMLSPNTIRIERLINLSVEDIKEMTLAKKYINNPNDSETGEYLIEEMSVAVKSDGISAAKCKLIKVS